MTTIRSARTMVERRWAITTRVFVFDQAVERFLNKGLVFRIRKGRGLVQHHNGTILKHGAGQCDALAFSPGKPCPSVTDHGLEALGQIFYKTTGCSFGSGSDLLIRGIRTAQRATAAICP